MRRQPVSLLAAILLATNAGAFVGAADAAAAPATDAATGQATAIDGTATSRYVALPPCRLTDTRIGLGSTVIDADTLRIPTAGCDIPDDAVAVVATTTVVRAETGGWLVAFAAGAERPTAATLNWTGGSTRGNAATIAIGDDGIDLHRSTGHANGDVVVDVSGAFVPTDTATSGRFVPLPTGRRLLDTRSDGTGHLAPGSTVRLALPSDVDPDAEAVSITVTAIDTDDATFVTAFPAGTPRPTTSVLNTDGPGQFRSASTIVPVNGSGLDLYVEAGTDLTVDMTGWFTGSSAVESASGLFVPMTPTRLRDTRPEVDPIHAGGTIEVALPGGLTDAVQATAPAALAVTMTMIGADERGFLTAHAARTERSATATGYGMRNELTAQFGVVSASSSGLAVYSDRGTDLTVDLLGWFTGDPVIETSDVAAPNPVRRQRVLAIGDSSMAGVRWYRALGALRGADWTFDGESCRRLVRFSCRGREGRYPPTALQAIEAVPDSFDVLVMMTGYNDVASTFEADLEKIMAAARSKHIRRVVWLTYSPEFRNDKGGAGAFQVYEFQDVLLRAAAQRYDDLTAVEWSAVTRQQPSWIHADGIHFTDDGAFGNADFMSRAVAHVTGQPCPVPATPGGPLDDVCPDPGRLPPPDVQSLYGFADSITQCYEVGASRTPRCVIDPYAR